MEATRALHEERNAAVSTATNHSGDEGRGPKTSARESNVRAAARTTISWARRHSRLATRPRSDSPGPCSYQVPSVRSARTAAIRVVLHVALIEELPVRPQDLHAIDLHVDEVRTLPGSPPSHIRTSTAAPFFAIPVEMREFVRFDSGPLVIGP